MIQAVFQDLIYQGIFCTTCDFTLQLIYFMLHCVFSYLQHHKENRRQ